MSPGTPSTLSRFPQQLDPRDGVIPAVIDGCSPVTIRSLVRFHCSYDKRSLADLKWLLGKFGAARMAHPS